MQILAKRGQFTKFAKFAKLNTAINTNLKVCKHKRHWRYRKSLPVVSVNLPTSQASCEQFKVNSIDYNYAQALSAVVHNECSTYLYKSKNKRSNVSMENNNISISTVIEICMHPQHDTTHANKNNVMALYQQACQGVINVVPNAPTTMPTVLFLNSAIIIHVQFNCIPKCMQLLPVTAD